jgi:hypothetical protein
MTARAWRSLRRNWRIPLTGPLLAQRFVAGPLFSALERMRDPLGAVEALYERLGLDGFSALRAAMAANIRQRGAFSARNAAPPADWQRQLRIRWQPIFEQYGYDAD